MNEKKLNGGLLSCGIKLCFFFVLASGLQLLAKLLAFCLHTDQLFVCQNLLSGFDCGLSICV